MQMKVLQKESIKCGRFGSGILMICIIEVLRNRFCHKLGAEVLLRLEDEVVVWIGVWEKWPWKRE